MIDISFCKNNFVYLQIDKILNESQNMTVYNFASEQLSFKVYRETFYPSQ